MTAFLQICSCGAFGLLLLFGHQSLRGLPNSRKLDSQPRGYRAYAISSAGLWACVWGFSLYEHPARPVALVGLILGLVGAHFYGRLAMLFALGPLRSLVWCLGPALFAALAANLPLIILVAMILHFALDLALIRAAERAAGSEAAAKVRPLSDLAALAGNVAHDIRNPLALILGNASRLHHELGEREDESAGKMLAKIVLGAERIDKIIHSYLGAASSIVRGTTTHEVVRVSELIARALVLCEDTVQKTRVQSLDVDSRADLTIAGDENELVMTLVNMLANACDAIARLDDRWIHIEGCQRGNKIELRVTDSGGGIPLALRERIFDRHFTTKGGQSGYGLGLDFVRKVVEAHRGRIHIDPAHPHTSFVLEFPVPANSSDHLV